jgi:hypothetical protein
VLRKRTSRLLAVVEQLKRLLEGLARLDSKAHFVLLSSRPHLNAPDLETG